MKRYRLTRYKIMCYFKISTDVVVILPISIDKTDTCPSCDPSPTKPLDWSSPVFLVGVKQVPLIADGTLAVAGALTVDDDAPFTAPGAVVPVPDGVPLVSTHRARRALQLMSLSNTGQCLVIAKLKTSLFTTAFPLFRFVAVWPARTLLSSPHTHTHTANTSMWAVCLSFWLNVGFTDVVVNIDEDMGTKAFHRQHHAATERKKRDEKQNCFVAKVSHFEKQRTHVVF